MTFRTPPIQSKSIGIDPLFKAPPSTSKAAAARHVRSTTSRIVSASQAAIARPTKASKKEPSDATTKVKPPTVLIVLAPKESRYQRLTALFIRTLPSRIPSHWGRNRPYFPSFHQNQIVFFPSPDGLKTKRTLYTTHPDIRNKRVARETLSSLFGDQKGSTWTNLIEAVDQVIDDLFRLSNTWDRQPLPPRTSTREFLLDRLLLPLAQADYQKDIKTFWKRSAQDYQTHIVLRVKLTLLLAIALQGHFPEITTCRNKAGDLDLDRTEANIGTLVLYRQAAHHSIAPNIPLTSPKPVMRDFLKELDLDKCAEELEALPNFEPEITASPSKPSVGRQLHILRSLLASGVDFESLVEAYDKDIATEGGVRTELTELIETKAPDKLLNQQTLTFILQNFTYPAEGFLNSLDSSVENCLRADIFKGDFHKVITGAMDLATYSIKLRETIATKVIDEACRPHIAAQTSYLNLRDKSLEMREHICTLINLLKKAMAFAEMEAISGVNPITEPIFPNETEFVETCRAFNTLLEELVELRQNDVHLKRQISSSYFQPFKLKSLNQKLIILKNDFLTPFKSKWIQRETRIASIEACLNTLISPDELAVFPSFCNPLAKPVAKDSSLLCRLNGIIHNLENSVARVPVAEFIQEGLEPMMADASSVLLTFYEALRHDQKHLFQHILSAQLIPLIQKNVPPESVPLSIVTAPAPLVAGDAETITETLSFITPPVVATAFATTHSTATASNAACGAGGPTSTPISTPTKTTSEYNSILGGDEDDTA